ncbi:MAG TPA: hypothetical protein VF458_16095 [Ktedonobacteraceae bacterium]
MQQKRRRVGFMLALLCTFALLLAACRAGPNAHRQGLTQHTTRLHLRETPAVMDTTTTTPGVTTAPAEYVGQVPTEKAWLGLSTSGKRMVAFVTDGSQDHPPTFAQWFRGSVKDGMVDASAPAKAGTDRLKATLKDNTATGTITLTGGKSIDFTANAIPASDQTAGLYRGEHEINKQSYVAGWIVLPAASAQGTATPSVTATGTSTASPTASETPSPSASVTASVTETSTPEATPSASATATGALQQGGALLNEQTFAVQSVPSLTPDQINSKQVSIPNEAIFKLVPCQKNLC